MGRFNEAFIVEQRRYQDEQHPEQSDYDVLLPVTVPEAVVDPDTGEKLSAILDAAGRGIQTAISTANSALEKANEALEGGGASGCVIKITFDEEFEGATYTITDGAGDTKSGVVPASHIDSVSVDNCNTTYTISATADGVLYSNTVTTGPYYGQYTAALAVFKATINVTAIANAVVSATCEDTTYTATAGSNGIAAITVKRSGTYTISAALSGKTSESATVNVTTDGSTNAATVKFVITTVPAQSGSLTYTGSEQTPEWSNFDESELTLGGTVRGTTATSYNATFTPKEGYKWQDNSTTAKTVAWSIGKAAGSLSINKTTMALNGSTPTGTITVTRAGTGAITATSSNEAVATATVSGTTVTVTAISEGTANITISVAADTNYTAPGNKSCSVTATDMVHIYGAEWDGTGTAWTRTDDAAGFADPVPYKAGMTAAQCSSPFDNKLPWSGMTKSNRSGGVEVAIPKFWYKLTQTGKKLKVQIADRAVTGYSVSPAHANRGDGKGERDIVYIGRYHCSTSDYKSTTGVKPKANITRSTARTDIHNLGANFWQVDFATRFTLWLLYIVEFADWNSQAKIGKGCGDNSATGNMGYTDSMPYHTGTTQSNRDAYGLGTQYRNIEGLWDNVYDWCDGCYNNSSGLNLILNPANFSDSSGGVCAGLPTSGWPSAFTVSSAGGYPIFYPTESSGSESSGSCDYWYFSASDPCLFVGGSYHQNTNLGLFYVDYYAATVKFASFGCRLLELP